MKLEELRDMFRKGEVPPESIPEPVVTETGGTIYAYSARSKGDDRAIREGTPYYEACKIVGFEKGARLDAVKVWFEEAMLNSGPAGEGFECVVISEMVYDANGKGFIKHILLVMLNSKTVTGKGYSIVEVCVESGKLVTSEISNHLFKEQAIGEFDKRRNSINASGRDIIRTQSWSE